MKPQRDLESVIKILRSSPSLRQKPGVASLLVLLFEHKGDIRSAVEVLDQCAASYASQKVQFISLISLKDLEHQHILLCSK